MGTRGQKICPPCPPFQKLKQKAIKKSAHFLKSSKPGVIYLGEASASEPPLPPIQGLGGERSEPPNPARTLRHSFTRHCRNQLKISCFIFKRKKHFTGSVLSVSLSRVDDLYYFAP